MPLVSAQPRINVNRGGGNPGGSRLGGNAFNRINTTRGFQNHHIISPTNPATKNHPLLRLAGFNSQKSIDSRPNRIYLPNPHKASHPKRATHCRKHTQMAMDKVAQRMNNIVKQGQAQNWNQSQYRSALRSMLANERQQLRKGSVNLYEKPDIPRKSK